MLSTSGMSTIEDSDTSQDVSGPGVTLTYLTYTL